MDLLKRQFAPILPDAWQAVDDEAARVLRLNLAGRKIVDFSGPHGWQLGAVNTGRLRLLPDGADPDINLGIRQVQPMLEVRVPIKLPLMELDYITRGARNPDLSPVVRAAEKIARVENTAIFGGFEGAGVHGIIPSSPHPAMSLGPEILELPRLIIAAKERLRQSGISGPYVLVLGPELYDQVFAAREEGHPLSKRIEQLLVDRPIVYAPALQGGLVLSQRGGDYELTVGQDFSIGYAYHDKHEIELYLTESFTFRVLEPAAAVPIKPSAAKAG
jgi:uncharacterized linocin/CFP29 family protein